MDGNEEANKKWANTDLGKTVIKSIRSNVAAGVENFRAELKDQYGTIDSSFLTIDEAINRLIESVSVFDNRNTLPISVARAIFEVEKFMDEVQDMQVMIREVLPELFAEDVKQARKAMKERTRSRTSSVNSSAPLREKSRQKIARY